jgi:hypothetical protein
MPHCSCGFQGAEGARKLFKKFGAEMGLRTSYDYTNTLSVIEGLVGASEYNTLKAMGEIALHKEKNKEVQTHD